MNIHALLISLMIMSITATELRPSDHGLEYQSTPPKGEELPPEMEEFFGTSATSPPTSRSSSGVALPKATTSNDTAWWNGVNRSRNNGGDRLRHVLLVATIACGVTGLALLVSSGFVYFLKYKKRKSSELVHHNNNCKAIVVSNTVKS